MCLRDRGRWGWSQSEERGLRLGLSRSDRAIEAGFVMLEGEDTIRYEQLRLQLHIAGNPKLARVSLRRNQVGLDEVEELG